MDLESFPRRPFVRLTAVGVVAAVLAFTVGVRVGRPAGAPAADSIDVRALQDLRYHHEQAVGMSLVLLSKPTEGASALLRQLARQIVTAQSEENGRMIELLARYGAPLANEGDTALDWMGGAVPINEMPGLAVDDDTTELAQSAGARADRLYVTLMVAHHRAAGVIAGDAAATASRAEVRDLARVVVASQQDELARLQAVVIGP